MHEIDPAHTPGPGDLLLIENGDAILAVGPSAEMEEWIASKNLPADSVRALSGVPGGRQALPPELREVASGATAFFIDSAPRPLQTSSEIRVITRDTATGRFVSNVPFDPALFAGVTPQTMMVMAAIESVQAALQEITDAIEEIGVDVQELLNLAHAEQLGDVHGRRRFLHAVLDGYQRTGALSTTDWESVAFLGPLLESGIERLRQYLRLEINDLDPSAAPAKRADRLGKKLAGGRWTGAFKLLVAAQDSFFTWQQLRLVRIADKEKEFLETAVSSAREALNKNLTQDQELVAELEEILSDYCVVKPNEVLSLGIRAKRRLTGHGEEIVKTVDDFLRHRGVQASEWQLNEHAGLRDGLRHARGVAAEAQRDARRVVAKRLDRVADWVNVSEDIEGDEDNEKGEGTTPRHP